MYRFRIYTDKEKNKENLCLDALIKESGEYEIMFSLSELFENLLKEGLSNDLSIIYIDEDTKEKKIEYMGEFKNASEALSRTEEFLNKWYNLEISIDQLRS